MWLIPLHFVFACSRICRLRSVTRLLTPSLRLFLLLAEMNMNATERTDAYCHLEQEAPAIIPSSRPPSPSWPSRGEISLQNLTLAYPSARASPVLHSVTFYIPPGTRVGVVGRTGAGKSSLLSALYRLVEAEEGSKVVIDGVDTRTLGLKDLRGRLAIVPQEVRLEEKKSEGGREEV